MLDVSLAIKHSKILCVVRKYYFMYTLLGNVSMSFNKENYYKFPLPSYRTRTCSNREDTFVLPPRVTWLGRIHVLLHLCNCFVQHSTCLYCSLHVVQRQTRKWIGRRKVEEIWPKGLHSSRTMFIVSCIRCIHPLLWGWVYMLCVCVCVCTCVCTCVCLSVCLSVCLFVCLSVCLSV